MRRLAPERLEDRTAPAVGDLLRSIPNPSGMAGDQFGAAVSVSFDFMLVGAPMADPGGVTDAGAAYLFNLYTGDLLATITSPSPSPGDHFGAAVALQDEDNAYLDVVIGAPGHDEGGWVDVGKAYQFWYSFSGEQSFADVIPNFNPTPGGEYGAAVAVSWETAVGAPGAGPGITTASGEVHFERVGSVSNPAIPAGSRFGQAVAVQQGSTHLATIGAPGFGQGGLFGVGAAYLYDISTRRYVAVLDNPSAASWDEFGAAVASETFYMDSVVGAPGDDPGGVSDAGTAYLYDADGTLKRTLANPAPGVGDRFGGFVSLYWQRVAVAAQLDNPGGVTDAGTVYLFNHTTGALEATLNNPSPNTGDRFGPVSINWSWAAVGAPGDDPGGATDAGSVYVFDTNTPPTAVADAVTVAEDSGAAVIDVLANDTAAPDYWDSLTITAVTQPAVGGSVTLTNGTVRFTPAANFTGTTSFTYTIWDGLNGTATATVTITVTSVNDLPTATDDTLTVAEDSGATIISVLANDTAAPDVGETLSVASVTQPAAGGAVTLTGGVVRFTPTASVSSVAA